MSSADPLFMGSAILPDGLRWVSDAEPGFSRRACGDGFEYFDAAGRPLRDAATLARIAKLAIPPAYRDVWICRDADGHLQATGRDARGRKQYRYHAAWQVRRGQTKFEALRQFGRLLPRLRARAQRQLAGGATPTRDRVLALLVQLLDRTWVRIGNDEYARSNGSYGLTTLRCRHARVQGEQLRLSFTGKSGVRHELALSDARIAAVVRRCRELPGQELFQYVDTDGEVRRIGSADVNGWLAEAAMDGAVRVTAKDFRTWHASVLALDLLLGFTPDGSRRTALVQIVEAVARRLGNTPAVCRKAYIHPAVLALCEGADDPRRLATLGDCAWARQPPARRGLSPAERRLLGLLATRRRALPGSAR